MRFLVVLVSCTFLFLISCSSNDPETYRLSVTSVPEEAGTVTPAAGEFEDGREIEISASSSEGWRFDRWQGDIESENNPTIITMDSDKDIAALFVKREYPLTIETIGEGEVSERVVTEKSTDYESGTRVELTAEPAEGWTFTRWEGDLESTENPEIVMIESPTEITALFSRIEYPLTVNIVGNGTVDEEVIASKVTDYESGTEVQLTAIPGEEYLFSDWTGDFESDENPATITIDGPKTVTATFLRTFKFTTVVIPEGAGTITPDSGRYVRDVSFEVEAVPEPGWEFTNWEGDFTGSVNPFDLTMNGNKTLVANFEREDYRFTPNISGEGEVEIELLSGTETDDGYLFESEIRLTAEADENWRFANWSGDIDSDDNPLELTIADNTEITANFEQVFYLNDNGITVHCPLASPGETGTLEGIVYTAVDREMLDQKISESADFTTVCTSLIEDMSELFYESDINQPIDNWDVSNVNSMKGMFGFSFNFNQPLNNWDVRNVTDMSGMFEMSDFNQSIGEWDVSNVMVMSNMFAMSAFNQPIGEWDVSNVANMSNMFNRTVFNQPIGNWEVGDVTDMSNMFVWSAFNQTIGNWDVSSVTNMESMFSNSAFSQSISNWNVSNVENMSWMFAENNFNLSIGEWDVGNVKNMSGMFYLSDFDQPIGDWDVSSVTDMSSMFNASDFNQTIGEWDVSNVINMNSMFAGTTDRNNYSLFRSSFNQDISRWDVSNVENMNEMFFGSNFNQPIGDWDVSNVLDMSGMFQASNFDQPIGDWTVESVTDMGRMFSGYELFDGKILKPIFNQPIGGWDVSNVTEMAAMFNAATLFNQDLSDWCVSNFAEKPEDFDTQTPEWELPKPVWGNCPD